MQHIYKLYFEIIRKIKQLVLCIICLQKFIDMYLKLDTCICTKNLYNYLQDFRKKIKLIRSVIGYVLCQNYIPRKIIEILRKYKVLLIYSQDKTF